MSGLGFRQRTILRELTAIGHAVPFGYLVRKCDDGCASNYNNTNVSLRLLRKRGLVVQPRVGWWAAA